MTIYHVEVEHAAGKDPWVTHVTADNSVDALIMAMRWLPDPPPEILRVLIQPEVEAE